MITVQKILADKRTPRIITLPQESMVIEALELMAKENIGAVMIMDQSRLAGIFSERDYARKGIVQGRKAKTTPVTEVMTAGVITVNPDTRIQDCMQLFSDKRIRHLPVMDNDRVIGMISIGDIVNAIISEQKEHIEFLEKYISS